MIEKLWKIVEISNMLFIRLGPEAQERIRPVVEQFTETVSALSDLASEVRVRSEQSVDMTRLYGPTVPGDMISSTHISPPRKPVSDELIEPQRTRPPAAPPTRRPGPPTILTPIQNIHVAEGTRVTLLTTFDNGIPTGE